MPASVRIGDRNVIVGNVVGKQESYYLSDNAKIIKPFDESRKIIVCNICGRRSITADTYRCTSCEKSVCLDCFDRNQKVCSKCAENRYEGKTAFGVDVESEQNHAKYLAQKQRHCECEAKIIQKTWGPIGAFVLAFFFLSVFPGLWISILFIALTLVAGLSMVAEGFERSVLLGLAELIFGGALLVIYMIMQFSKLFS